MVGNYRAIAALWLAAGLWAAAGQASADTVRVGQFELTVAVSWQRAADDEEKTADSIILRHGDDVTVYLPQREPRVKMEADRFFSRLEQGWQSRYGDRAERSWLEIGDARWRVCRRPSVEGPGVVFELVTLHDGRAYQAVVAAPAETAALPESVRALLTGGRWQPETTTEPMRPETP
jgi:hypothetical protein